MDQLTEEEINEFIRLRDKIQKVEQSIAEAEASANMETVKQLAASGVIPHQLNITVITDVYKIESEQNMSPVLLEKFSQSYIIDFLDKSYKPLIDAVYENMTQVLTNSCKDIYQSNNSGNDEVSV